MSILKNAVALVGLLIASTSFAHAGTVNIISDRSDFHVKPVIQSWEEITGHTANVLYVEKGTIPARLSAKADKVDVVIATDLPTLAIAKEQGYITEYLPMSYRARTIVYNKDKVDPATLTGYNDLTSEEYKGRVCMRPLTHPYNITLISEMIVDRGEEYARNWVNGVIENLAVKPSGNDRKQGTLVAQGVCDIAVMNTYYYGLLLSNNKQRSIANATQLFFPEQDNRGTYVLYSGIGKVTNTSEAQSLINFMLGTVGQNHFAQVNFEYPVKDDVAYSIIAQGFGEGQPGIENGNAKFNHVDVEKVAAVRELAVEIVTKAGK